MSNPWYDYPVTQGYGVNGEQGVDIGTPFHTPITDIYSGTVVQEGYGGAGGVVGILTNVPGLGQVVEYFLHLDLINVVQGQFVKAGQLIGLSGGENPGYPGGLHPASPQFSTGPHTEFGFFAHTPLFVGNSVGDPLAFLPRGSDIPHGQGSTAQNGGPDNSGGLSWWQVFLNGLGIGINNTVNPADPGGTGTFISTFLRGLGIGINNTVNPAQGIDSWLTGVLQQAGLFILALMLVVIGIVLIAHDPSEQGEPVFHGLLRKAATA